LILKTWTLKKLKKEMFLLNESFGKIHIEIKDTKTINDFLSKNDVLYPNQT